MFDPLEKRGSNSKHKAPVQELPQEIIADTPVEASQEVETNHEIETQADSQEIQEPVRQERPQDRNWRELRERADRSERLEREAERLYRENEALRAAKYQQPQQQEDDEVNLAPDDIAEGKHLNKVGKKVDREIRKLQEELNQYKQQTAAAVMEAKVKSKYPDFDSVVSDENIARLRENHPELAQTLSASTDLYSTAVSAYTLIKRLGIYQERGYDHEKAIAQKNAAKPRPLASVSPQQGETPLTRANAFAHGLTTDLKEQLWKEMQAAKKAY